MHGQLERRLIRLFGKIGSCARCMRQSLEAAIIAWILFALVVTYSSGMYLRGPIGILSLALSALWLLHVSTYAARA